MTWKSQFLPVECYWFQQVQAYIDDTGVYIEQLEEDPSKYLPEVKQDDLSSQVVKVNEFSNLTKISFIYFTNGCYIFLSHLCLPEQHIGITLSSLCLSVCQLCQCVYVCLCLSGIHTFWYFGSQTLLAVTLSFFPKNQQSEDPGHGNVSSISD